MNAMKKALSKLIPLNTEIEAVKKPTVTICSTLSIKLESNTNIHSENKLSDQNR